MKNKNIEKLLLYTGLTAVSIYAANQIINRIANSKKTGSKSEYNIMKWRYGEIAYRKKGNGTPLLFIHDLKPYSSSCEWECVEQSLSKKYCVYTIDLLGCGNSEKPNMTYTNYLYVELVTDFIKTIIGEKTNVIVSGDSGSFVIMACNMYPQYFRKILLVNPTKLEQLAKIPNKTKIAFKYILDTPMIGTFLYNMIYTKANIKNNLLEKGFYKKHIVPNKLITNYYVSAHKNESKGKYLYSSIVSYYTNINIIVALKRINHSIILISGEKKKDAKKIIQEYRKENPSIEYTFIKNAAEYPHIENAKDFVENVQIYLD